jgi:hypothetical protein
LDVNGTGRFADDLYLTSGEVWYGNSTSAIPIIIRNNWGADVGKGTMIGAANQFPSNLDNTSIYGDRNRITGVTNASQTVIVGTSNSMDSSTNCILIGAGNSAPNPSDYQIMLGYGNLSNSGISIGDRTSIVIGRNNNTNGYLGGGLIGNGLKYYENGQLAFGGNSSNVINDISNVYFGRGVKNEGNTASSEFGHGPDVAINPSWANDVDSINRNGGSLTIAGGRGTGTGTPGTVRFSTWNSTTSGSTLHPTLTERARISPAGNLLVGTATDVPSSKLTVTSTTQGFLQPIVTNTQRDAISTPAQGLQIFSTTDSANYVYRGTGGGWQKIANEISGSATLNFPSTGHGNSAELTFTLTGAAEGDVVALGIPNASIVANASFTAWVSATNTVTVRFNNYAGSGSSDPASGTFKIKVFK